MWTIGSDADEFARNAGPWLRRDPVLDTIPVTMLASVLAGAYGSEVRFGWWTENGRVCGAALQTPPRNLVLASMSWAAATALADAWPPDDIPGVSGRVETAEAFSASFGERTGAVGHTHMAQRLYRLGRLSSPRDVPGRARTAGPADRDLVFEWARRFTEDAGASHPPRRELLTRRLEQGLITLWEEGDALAMASATETIGGVSRVGLVYTPPAHRRRGFGAAVTAAMTGRVLDAGATEVVLFTDLANPVSNSIYRAIGYRPVADYAEIAFS